MAETALERAAAEPAGGRGAFVRRAVAPVWLALATAGALYYYRQVFNLLRLGPQAWIEDNYSLAVFLRPVWHALTRGELPGLPQAWPEAALRAGLAVFGVTVVVLAAQLFGAGVLWLVGRASGEQRPGLALGRAETVLFRTALGLGAVAYLCLALALVGRFRPSLVGSLLVISALGALVRGARDKRTAAGHSMVSVLPRGQRVWAALIVLALALSLLAALAPEVEHDALWYHLWLPEQWFSAGRPVDIVHEYIALYPLTWDLLFGAASTLGGAVAGKLVHWICLPLGALLAAQMTRRFFPGAPAWLAAAIFVTTPTVFWEATTAYIDLALALYIGLALYAALRYVQAAQAHGNGSAANSSAANSFASVWLLLAALSLGLALAIKHLALFAYLLIVPAVAVARWRSTGRWQAALAPALVLGGLSLLLPLPWYLRAWLASGNPFFPDLYSIFGASPVGRWSEITEAGLGRFKERFGMGRSPLALLLLPWNVTMHATRFAGSLGPVFLLLLSGAVFLPWRRGSPRLRRFTALAAFCLAYLALWALPISSFQLRFLAPLAPILAALAAALFPRLYAVLGGWRSRRGARMPALFSAGLAGLLLMNLPPFLSLHEGDRQGDEGWLAHVHHRLPVGVALGYESQPAYLARSIPAYRAWKYINGNLPQEARVLTFTGGDNLYGRRDRLASDATLAHPGVWGAQAGQEAQAIAYLRELGITHVLVEKAQLDDFSPTGVPLMAPGYIDRWLSLEYEDARLALYSVRVDAGDSP